MYFPAVFTYFSLCLLYMTMLLFSCSNINDHSIEIHPDNTTHFNGHAMTIDYHIIIGRSLDGNEISKINTLVKTTFQEIDSIYNKWNPDSELSRLNRLKSNVKVPLSSSLENLLKLAQLIVELSEGRFDPTIEPLQQLWKAKLQKGHQPTESEIAAIAPAIGWHKIHFGDGLFVKDHDLTAMDLGGIAKGLCVDLIAERLYEQGFSNTYVEWGGEIRCKGQHPDKRYWTIFISRLGSTDPSQAITMLALDNSSIATSGDYLQNWTIDSPTLNLETAIGRGCQTQDLDSERVEVEGGIPKSGKPPSTSTRSESKDCIWHPLPIAVSRLNKNSSITFFHIFDPRTLRPLESSGNSVASASVGATSCAFADGLATAAMMFPSIAEAEVWANTIKEKFPDISFWLISRGREL